MAAALLAAAPGSIGYSARTRSGCSRELHCRHAVYRHERWLGTRSSLRRHERGDHQCPRPRSRRRVAFAHRPCDLKGGDRHTVDRPRTIGVVAPRRQRAQVWRHREDCRSTRRASDGFSAWSGRFDRRLDDIFTVQDDIAGMIAETLTRRVAKASGPLVTSKTSNTEAYSLYLEGRYLWNKRPGDVVAGARSIRASDCHRPEFCPHTRPLAGVYGTLGAWGTACFRRPKRSPKPRPRRRERSNLIRSWLPGTRQGYAPPL